MIGERELAMMKPTVPGWKVTTLGDDIAWMKIRHNNRLHAINPEAGFFGVAPGTSAQSNPMAMATIQKNTIFTNCLLTDNGDIWWEGMGTPCSHGIDWTGKEWTPSSRSSDGKPAPGEHPNARFTAPAKQCPAICSDWENPEGVPIDIFIFGGRRSTLVPLVTQAYDWDHGVFMGATAASEATAAALDVKKSIRRDPMAMLPFCGYHIGDYWQHWFNMGDRLSEHAPKIFYVNWFRKSSDGRWLWPGFGDNVRVLKWMCDRVQGCIDAQETPIGFVPHPKDLDTSGLSIPASDLTELLKVDIPAWQLEIPDIDEHLNTAGTRLPQRMKMQSAALKQRLGVQVR